MGAPVLPAAAGINWYDLRHAFASQLLQQTRNSAPSHGPFRTARFPTDVKKFHRAFVRVCR